MCRSGAAHNLRAAGGSLSTCTTLSGDHDRQLVEVRWEGEPQSAYETPVDIALVAPAAAHPQLAPGVNGLVDKVLSVALTHTPGSRHLIRQLANDMLLFHGILQRNQQAPWNPVRMSPTDPDKQQEVGCVAHAAEQTSAGSWPTAGCV